MKPSTTKSLLAALFFVTAFFLPTLGTKTAEIIMFISLLTFLAGVTIPALMVYNSLHNKLSLAKPKWHHKMETQKPLTTIQFLAVVLLAYGMGALIAGGIYNHQLDFTGSIIATLGLGMLLGIQFMSKKIAETT